MADSVDRLSGISGYRSTERVTATTPAPKPRHKNEESDFSYEDKVDVHAPKQAEAPLEEIDLSVPMIRAIAHGDLPPESMAALVNFAPLGDLSGADALCDRVVEKGLEFVTWPNTLTLAQALERAAS